MAEQFIPSSTKPGAAGIADACVIDRYFQIPARGSMQKCEVMASITIFMTMVYAVFVVPGMLGKTGFDTNAVFIAVRLTTAFGSLLMGLWARLPIAIGCVISLIMFMAFDLVLGQKLSSEITFGAVFLMGVVLAAISAMDVCLWILHNLPSGVAYSTGIGTSLSLLLITSNGMGLAVKNANTGLPVALGHVIAFPMMMSVLGLTAIFGMGRRRVPGGILVVIIAIPVLDLILGLVAKFIGVFAVPSLATAGHASLIGTMDIRGTLAIVVLPSVLALMMTAMFDAAGTIRAVAGQIGLLDDKGHIIDGGRALTTDSISPILSMFFGGTPATAYIESTADMATGDKTGPMAVVVGLMFLIVMFFSLLAGLVPPYATAPALMYVGSLMLSSVSKLHMDDIVDALSGLVYAVFIVLTCNIITGIMFDFNMLVIDRLVAGEWRRLNIGTVVTVTALVTFYIDS